MSTANEITRLNNAKSAIADAIANKGVTVPAATKLDGMASLIGQIEQGGKTELITGSVGSAAWSTTAYFTDENGEAATAEDNSDFTCPKNSIVFVEGHEYGWGSMWGGEILRALPYTDSDGNALYAFVIQVQDDGFILMI